VRRRGAWEQCVLLRLHADGVGIWQAHLESGEDWTFICPWHGGGQEFFTKCAASKSLVGIDSDRHVQLGELLGSVALGHLLGPLPGAAGL
jgi:hypothetical protein